MCRNNFSCSDGRFTSVNRLVLITPPMPHFRGSEVSSVLRSIQFGTGLTFGLVGSTVSDNYELTMTISMNDKSITKSVIKNGIATAIGNTSTPAGVETFTPSLAFQKVLEQMILQALKEIQADNSLSSTSIIVLSGKTKQKIEELQGLRKEGLISEKEYQQKRKALLGN